MNEGNAILISVLTAIIVYCMQFQQIKFHWALWIVIACGYILAFTTWLTVITDKEIKTLQKEKLKLECEKIEQEIINLKRQ